MSELPEDDLPKGEAKTLFRSLEEALRDWKQEEPEPEFCECGEQILPVEPIEKIIYCDKQNQWIHKPDTFGVRPFWYGHCPAFAKKQIEKTVQAQKQTEYKTLDGNPMDFSTFTKNEANSYGCEKAIAFVRVGGGGRIIFAAGTGRGKTHLARAIFIALLATSKPVRWITSRDLADLFVASQAAREGQESQAVAVRRIEGFKRAHCLFIDDLGAEKETGSELFFEQFQGLLEQLQGGFVITTNLNSAAIESRYGPKIFARLFVNTDWVELRNPNYRSTRYPKFSEVKGA